VVYRLTAIGNGANAATVVMLQSEQLLVFQCMGAVNVALSGRLAWRWL
jgi:hypothetical protein